MCIICNCGANVEAAKSADAFLTHFAKASQEMKQAEAALLDVSRQLSGHPYDRTHKAMVSLRRQWNQLEQQREVHAVPAGREK